MADKSFCHWSPHSSDPHKSKRSWCANSTSAVSYIYGTIIVRVKFSPRKLIARTMI